LTNFFLSDWFAYVLKFLNNDVGIGNFAVTIVVFTLLVKLLILPLDIRQRKASLKTSALSGKMADIKRRYSDPQTQQKKIQELYRKEGVSSMASCLPSLISLPILIALVGSVAIIANEQLAQFVLGGANADAVQPFFWVKNMWQPDSGLESATVIPSLQHWENMLPSLQGNNFELYNLVKDIDYTSVVQPAVDSFAGYANGWFILPLLCGGLQVLQAFLMPQSINPQTGKPQGRGMFYVMAAVGVVICVSQSAVFALYWVMSTLTSIVVQLLLNKTIQTKKNEKEVVVIE
jgi:YidC/Oxa1 family membrane protein insertase